MHPTNTCQPSHVAPLVKIYGGTMSRSDRLLLSIFRLFEQYRRISIATLLHQWSAQSTGTTNRALDALLSLESTVVFHTCAAFPHRTVLSTLSKKPDQTLDVPSLYDPMFVLLLLGRVIGDDQASLTGLDLVQILRTNAVGLAMCALGSREAEIRKLAFTILTGVWKSVQVSFISWPAQSQVIT